MTGPRPQVAPFSPRRSLGGIPAGPGLLPGSCRWTNRIRSLHRSGCDNWLLFAESQRPRVRRKSHRSESGNSGNTVGQPEQTRCAENPKLLNASPVCFGHRRSEVAGESRWLAATRKSDRPPVVRCDPGIGELTVKTSRCIAAGPRHITCRTPGCFSRNR